jgi:membrane protein implicated in regulation of membrane protease activity
VVLYVVPGLPWEYQLIMFSVLSVASIVLWKRYTRKHPPRTDQPSLNRRGTQYIGRIFTLEAPIVNGVGKIRVDDTTWKVNGADCPAGTHVEVVGIRGTVLQVEPRREHEGIGQRPVSTT